MHRKIIEDGMNGDALAQTMVADTNRFRRKTNKYGILSLLTSFTGFAEILAYDHVSLLSPNLKSSIVTVTLVIASALVGKSAADYIHYRKSEKKHNAHTITRRSA